jgi:hypothetical protein
MGAWSIEYLDWSRIVFRTDSETDENTEQTSGSAAGITEQFHRIVSRGVTDQALAL